MLSVIIPVFNSRQYLGRLVESLINQTYREIEIILVDDGATDGSAEICTQLASLDNRIVVIHKKNGGQSSARNKGLEIARGDYITFADHDDMVHPDMYRILISTIEAENADVCACRFANIDNQEMKETVFEKVDSSPRKIEKDELVSGLFKTTWWIPVWNKVYRAELLKNLKFKDVHLGEDTEFSYQIIKRCKRYMYYDTVLYYQRMHGNNYEFTAIEYMTELLKVKEELLNDIKKTFPDIYKECQEAYLYECIRIYNAYTKKGNEDRACEFIKEMIKRNSKGIIFSNMPIGRKLVFLKIKYPLPWEKQRGIIVI